MSKSNSHILANPGYYGDEVSLQFEQVQDWPPRVRNTVSCCDFSGFFVAVLHGNQLPNGSCLFTLACDKSPFPPPMFSGVGVCILYPLAVFKNMM